MQEWLFSFFSLVLFFFLYIFLLQFFMQVTVQKILLVFLLVKYIESPKKSATVPLFK